MVFSNYWNGQQQNCDCDEADRLREENERLERRERERYEARQQELRERCEAYRHSASDWREALDKQAGLYASEASRYPDLDDEGIDSFAIAAEACQKAAEFWDKVEAQKRPEIEELEAKIEALREAIRLEVCSRLRDFYAGKPGAKWVESYVTSSLEEGGDQKNWLNW